jgi:hypothetical protein
MKKHDSFKIVLFLIFWGFAPFLYANRLILNDINWPLFLFPESKNQLSGLGKEADNK